MMRFLQKLSCLLPGALSIVLGIGSTVSFSAPLSKIDAETALRAAGFSHSGNQLLNQCDEPADYRLNVADLNGDGILEIFILDFSSMCYGVTGGNLFVLMKDARGRWKKIFDLPASCYKLLSSRNKGFPDIETGGPGSCNGVWQWTGARYEYKCSREEKPGGCAREGVTSICR